MYSSVFRAVGGLCGFSLSLHCYLEEKHDIYRFPLHDEPLVKKGK